MCTDFISLNKARPKDFYPLLCLTTLADGSAGHEVFDFMDALRGYHQIKIYPEDEEKTVFMKEYGLYCWMVLPFGLKNAGATYKKMVNSIFTTQIGRDIEIYIDDIIMEYALRFTFPTTNNEAEYEAMVVGLAIAKLLGINRI
ncbi:hypothetical protein LIER_19025 [Lithospermum erythrorhizon]|uniref:Reverse transcriptase domain-containing protein n=1 Tax=Lithospermum erythrorhizon TaxID=34254 RepID=A0AAV3QGA7_LITER